MVEWRSNETEGDDFWYAWSTMFPADWAEPSGWGDIVRWTSALSYPPALRFNARADTLLVNMTSGDVESGAPYRNEIVALPSLSLGSWHDFVVHVSWTAEPSGVVAMWHRTEGETELRRVVCLTAIPTLHRASTRMVPPHYVRQGLARDQTAFVSTVYQDGFRRGTSWAAVTEELGAPPEPSASCP